MNNNVNYGEIIGANYVGGIAGYLTMPSIDSNTTYSVSNNENKNAVTGNSRVGGIFGEVYGMYYDAYYDKFGYFEMSVLTNTAEITGSSTGNDVGGLIGKATRLTVFTTCENTANITGGTCAGGFAGYAPGVNIKATGTENNNIITGKCYLSGFAGLAGIIENAVNNGEIISTSPNSNGDTCLGGIAGYINISSSNVVNDNQNYGVIVGADIVGGIAGYLTMPSVDSNVTYTVSNNKNYNTVTGANKVSGIFGEVYGMFYDAYYDKYGYFEVINCVNEAEITGTSYVGGIVGAYTRLKTDSNIMDTNTTLYGEELGQ